MNKNSKVTIHRYTNLYVKRRLTKLEVDIFGIIANGLLHHTPKAKMMAQLKKEILITSRAIELDQSEIHQLWLNAYSHYLTVSKKTFSSLRKIELKFGKKEDYEESLKQRRAVIYNSIRAKIQKNDLVREANTVMFRYEYRLKHDQIFGPFGLIAKAQDAGSGSGARYSPFFLASSHPKPAKDHAAWEGKMYYDADWEKFVPESDPNHKSISAYIRNHKIQTVQWVVGAPVYLCTRRNCKHYLKNLPLDDVLHASNKKLLKKYRMYMPEEVPASKEVLMYREYRARLQIEEMLQDLVPNEKLESDIKKDKKLLEKWKNML